ncbi:hypothetical protein RHSIM_Rhsim11G0083900 [Rhododendron simsii]|uniref:Cellulose synthase n=1 Tax=Rhododendron simsii TaxID=118357 RepID=A0A834G5K7_RHOSS|nr:hypothetical protein RHSIM_Rhsim11G0083900 [Rhododendron simsii]
MICSVSQFLTLSLQREYEEFKVRINGLVAVAQKVPVEGWTRQDGTPWPGNNLNTILELFRCGQNKKKPQNAKENKTSMFHDGVHEVEGNQLPHLIYVSREKRLGFDHHKNAGAMNALINMKGLDGIQGPIYVGTGCVLRRQALYGSDVPAKKKATRKACNCLPKLCCCCCGSSRKISKKGRSKENKKIKIKEQGGFGRNTCS